MITKTHNYHLLSPSPWPLMVSISSFNLFFSILLLLKFNNFYSLMTSLIFSSLMSFMWWLNYSTEFNFIGMNNFNLEQGVKMGMILFISSEVLFFFSFFWSYFHFFLSPGLENGFSWPPQGVSTFEAFNVPMLNTLILLSSGVLVTISHMYLNMGMKIFSNVFLFSTVIFGFIFTYFQALEYMSSFFCMSDGNYGTSFFMLTGFHGIHVLIGSTFLLAVLFLSISSLSPSKSSFLSFELAAWYWHFVDVVWIFLFFFLYYLNN